MDCIRCGERMKCVDTAKDPNTRGLKSAIPDDLTAKYPVVRARKYRCWNCGKCHLTAELTTLTYQVAGITSKTVSK